MTARGFLYPYGTGKNKKLNKNYLLLESGGRIQLEDGSGFILLEKQTEGTVSDWQMKRGRRI